MALSLIRGKYVICKIRSRTAANVIEDGAVVQRDGTILAVGPYATLAQHYQPDETLGSAAHADLVLMPWRHLAYPYLDPVVSVIDAVVHRGKVSGVETVLVAGAPVLRDGQITRVDKAAVLEELATALRQPLSQEEAHRRRLARDVFPHVQRFYDGWLDAQAREPFYRPSSRHYPGRT